MDKRVLDKAIGIYGTDMQLNMCIEEMSELTKEICKYKRGQHDHDAIVEEMADVYIMLEQLQMMMVIDPEELNNMIFKKVDRLKERLG